MTKSEVNAPPNKLPTRRKASDPRAVDELSASLTSLGSLDLDRDHSKSNSATSIIVKSSSVARRSSSTLPTPAADTRTRVKSSNDLKTLPDEDATAVLGKPRRSRSRDGADNMIATNRSFAKNRRIELEELEEMDRRLKMRSLGRTIKKSSFRNMFTAETDDRISACLNRAKEIEQELKDKLEKEGEEKIHPRASGDGKPTHRRPIKSARPTRSKTTALSSTPTVRPSRRTSSAAAAAVVDKIEESGLESSLSSLKEGRPCILQLPASRDVSPLGNEDHLLLEAAAKNNNNNHTMNISKRRSSSDGIPKREPSNDAERPIMRRPSNDGGDRPKRSSSHDGVSRRAKTSRRPSRSSKQSTPLAKSDRSNKRSSTNDVAPAAAEGARRRSSDDGVPVADDLTRRQGDSEDCTPRRTTRGGVDAPRGRKGTGVTASSRNSNKSTVASRSQEPVVKYVSSLSGGCCTLELPPDCDDAPHRLNKSMLSKESNKSTLNQRRQSNDSSEDDARPRRRRSSTTTPTRKSSDIENPVKTKGKKLLTKNSTPCDTEEKELRWQQLNQDARSSNDSDSTVPNLRTTGDNEVDEVESTDAKPKKKFIPGEKSHRRWFGRSNSDQAFRDMTVLIEEQAALVVRQATLNKSQEKKGIWSRFSKQ